MFNGYDSLGISEQMRSLLQFTTEEIAHNSKKRKVESFLFIHIY